jgi:predicted enzyme related to lactoylglutathione lyase
MTTTLTSKFVWFDYVVQDVAKATGFLGELFNWKTQEIPLGSDVTYTMLTVDGEGIGGILKTPKGAPPEAHWLAHLRVSDAKAASAKAAELGGKVLKPASKMGELGTMAIVADPLGGAFALWEPTKPTEDAGDFKGKAGNWVWNELYTDDVAKSVAFYTKFAGFTEEKMPMKDGSYHILNAGGKGRAGVMKSPMPMPQAWLPYVQVASVDDSVAKAKKLGATVHLAGEDIQGVGRIAIFSDPQGGMLGLLQPAPGM